MKWAGVPKNVVLAGAGVLLVGGVILAGESKRGGGGRSRPDGGARPAASADADDDNDTKADKVNRVCPTNPAVEDPTIAPTLEQLKPRFATNTCMKNTGGVISACVDATPQICETRIANVKRFFKNAGECVPRPAEVFCASLVNANDDTKVLCFDENAKCEEFRQSRSKRKKICRVTPTCVRIPL